MAEFMRWKKILADYNESKRKGDDLKYDTESGREAHQKTAGVNDLQRSKTANRCAE